MILIFNSLWGTPMEMPSATSLKRLLNTPKPVNIRLLRGKRGLCGYQWRLLRYDKKHFFLFPRRRGKDKNQNDNKLSWKQSPHCWGIWVIWKWEFQCWVYLLLRTNFSHVPLSFPKPFPGSDRQPRWRGEMEGAIGNRCGADSSEGWEYYKW